MLPGSTPLMVSRHGSSFILSFLVAFQRCFCGFNEPKVDSASLCALRTAQAPGAISRDILAAEYIPLTWFTHFKGHNLCSSLMRHRFRKVISLTPQFEQKKPKTSYKSHELLFYLKATSRGIKAPRYCPSPCCDEDNVQLLKALLPAQLITLETPTCASGVDLFYLNIS